MASRVNVKFVVILLAAMITAGGIAGTLWWWQIRQDAERNARLGDEAMEEGDISGARTFYGKAVRREPGNRTYLEKYENALLMLVPETRDRASELYQQRLGALQHAAQHFPQDPEGHLRLLEELHRGGRLRLGQHYFERLESAADNMFDRVNPTEPKREYARLYRSIARFKLRDIYTLDDLELTEDDLMVFLEAYPESDLGWATLVMAQWTSAEQLDTEGQQRRAQEKFREAASTFRQAMDAAPDGLEMAKARTFEVRFRIRDEVSSAESVSEPRMQELRDELSASIDHMLDTIAPDAPPWSVLEVMSYIEQFTGANYDEHAERVFHDYLQEHPEHPMLRLRYAQLQETWRRFDKVEEHVQTLIDAEPLPVGMLAQVQFTMVKPSAMSMMVDLEYQRWTEAESDEQKQKHVQSMEQYRDELRSMIADKTSPAMLAVEGKVEFVKGNYLAAAQRFEELLKDRESFEYLIFAMQCHEQLNNIGLAHERAAQAVELNPRNVSLIQKKAQLELEMRRYADAEETIRQGQELRPDDPVLARMMSVAESRGERGTQDTEDPVVAARLGARDAWQEGDAEEARAILLKQLERSPDDIRLLDMLARVEFGDGNRQRAIEYVNRALELNPGVRALEQLKARLQHDDRIDALKALVQSLHSDEGEVAAAMITGLHALKQQASSRVEQLEAEGDADAAAEARELAERADRELQSYVAKAEELVPDHPALIEYRIRDAVNQQQWDRAERAIQRAGELNLDGADGELYEARYRIVRGQYEDAVRILLNVTSRMDYSASAWRTLGLAYVQLGNSSEAARAYGQAYRVDPTRLDVVRSYIQTLLQTGEQARALEVARNATQLAPEDEDIRNAWLQLEAEVGDVGVAIRERRQDYEDDPDDRANGVRLAALLGQTEPDRLLILDDEGQPQYNQQQWRRLSTQERTQILQQKKQQWQEEADEIVERLAAERDGADLQIAALRAQLLRTRGEVAAGEQILRDFITGHEPAERSVQMYLVLGRYLSDANRPQDAIEVYRQALEYQQQGDTSVHVALGDLYFNRSDYEQALEHFERVLEASDDNPAVELRVVECLASLDRLDEAERRLNEYERGRGADFMTWMLYAAIAERRGELLLEQDKTVEAKYQFDQFRTALDNAQERRPNTVLPKVREARQQVHAYRRTGERSHLDDALRTLAEADQIIADDQRVSMLRVEVFREMGDVRAAINELRRMLERDPRQDRMREVLVSLHMQENNVDSAIKVVEEGIANNPSLAQWHVQLANLKLNYKNQPREALQSYMQALQLHPTPELVAQIVRTRLAVGMDPIETVRFVEQHRQFMNTPVVISAYARALAAAEQPDAIKDVLRRIYQSTNERIQRGEAEYTAMGLWFQIAGQIVPPLTLQQVEDLFMELSDGEPRAFELSSLAYLWQSRASKIEDVEHALALQRQAVSKIGDIDPLTQSPYYYDLGNMLVSVGDYTAAAEAFRRCSELNPDHALAINNHAYLLSEHLDSPEQALPLAERAVSISPDNPSALDTAGWVNYRMGNLEQAEQYLRKALDIQEKPATLVHLAEVLIEKGQLDQALDGPLRRAEELQPDDKTQAEIDRLLADIRTRRAQGQ